MNAAYSALTHAVAWCAAELDRYTALRSATMEEVKIGDSGAYVTLSRLATPDEEGWRSFHVSMHAQGFHAEEVVHDHVGFVLPNGRTGTNGLQELVAETAHEYRGWEGAKHWTSIEFQLSIEATSDRTGHATFVFSLGQLDQTGWAASLEIVLDVMERERLAGELRRFFAPRAV